MTLPASVPAAFRLAASELGMCSAARLFAAELLAAGGPALLDEARERLGPGYPVFDLVASEVLEQDHARPAARDARVDAAPVARALGTAKSLVVVGLEAFFLDALVPALPDVRVGLVLGEGGIEGEGEARRVLANFGGRVEEVRLGDVQRWAGRRSALLTFVYGTTGPHAYVAPVWLRTAGSDVRPQFRTLIGWDVLGRPPSLYPRWLVETPIEPFSSIVSA